MFAFSLKRILLLCLIACSLSLHAEEKKPEEPSTPSQETSGKAGDNKESNGKTRAEIITAPVDLFQQSQSDLKHYLPETSPLLIGTQEYVTQFHTSNTVNSKGVFILLPDWQGASSAAKNLAILAQQLPDLGWSTLSIQAINKPENYPSHALKKEDKEREDKAAIDSHKATLAQITQALLEKVAELPGAFIFVSEGNHGSLLLDVLSQENMPQPNGIVLLSAYIKSNQPAELPMLMAKKVADSSLPVLDLILLKENPLVIEHARLREKAATKALKVMYRQQKIHNFTPNYYPEVPLTKAIQGWLKSIGW